VRKRIAALALVFLAAHLPFLPPTLEDIDSINFALGVAEFDVAKHQPHPPGYPVFIALGKASTSILRAVHVPSAEVRGLALWSALSGAALTFPLYAFFAALGSRSQADRAWWATLITVSSPLFWFTALRPLSDTTGLAAAILAQALIVTAIMRPAAATALAGGAFVAGLAIGVRSQTFLLTLPLLGLALALPRLGLSMRDRLVAVAGLAAGVLVWAIPLFVVSGGMSAYAAALGSQAGEDFSGVAMLWTMRTARVAADAVVYSFLWPWGHPIVGGIVMVLAAIGALRLLWKMPLTLAVVLLAFVPYAIFHLLFQETITIRYALPLVVPIAFMAVCALEWPGRRLAAGAAIALAGWSLVLSVPAMAWYGRHHSPAFQALEDAGRAAAGDVEGGTRAIGFHAVARRAVDWLETAPSPDRVEDHSSKEPAAVALVFRRHPIPVLKAPHGQEWLTLISQWRGNPNTRTWFVADPRRTDLALFDPRARTAPVAYRWGFNEPPFVGGTRPGDSDLYTLTPPGWMLDRGWALTAEVAGVTAKDGLGPHRRPSVAWVRTRNEAATVMIGGRHLGAANDPAARVSASLNGTPVDSFEVRPGFFLRLISLPAGSLGAGAGYIPLEVSSAAADGSTRIMPVGLEQFDLQSNGTPMLGAQEGWFEPEYDPRTARSWRWSSEKSTLWVRPIGRDLTLTLSGESPLRYYEAAPNVIVTVGGREVARFHPSADFTQEVVLPDDALERANGQVVLTSDKFFVPAERGGLADKRHLALRIYSYSVR
jgi:hypothetical protein